MGCYKMRIMPLGSPHGLMAEQELHGANVGAVGEQLDGERVAEAMRPRADAGKGSQACDRAAEVLSAGDRISPACPKEVGGISGRERFQRLGGVRVQQHFQRDAGLHDSQRQVRFAADRPIKGRAAELGNVADPEAAVEQHINQGACSPANVGGLGWIVTRDPITGANQLDNLRVCIRKSGNFGHSREAKAAGRILYDPRAIDAPMEESAQQADFFALGGRAERLRFGLVWRNGGALRTEAIQGSGVDHREGTAGAAEFEQVREEGSVNRQGAFPQFSRAAIGEESLHGHGECEGGKIGQRITFLSALLDKAQAVLTALPVGGAKRAGYTLACRKDAIEPDGAGAERVVPAFVAVGAAGKVAAVQSEHSARIARVTRIVTRRLAVLLPICFQQVTWRKPMGVDRFGLSKRLQVIDFTLHGCTLNHCFAAICHVRDRALCRPFPLFLSFAGVCKSSAVRA